jgi:ribosomal protein L14E/L6E/L27E
VKALDESICIGRMVYAKAGRDKGKYFLIIRIVDDKYVYISDGESRTVEKPKKKKIIHIKLENLVDYELAEKILNGNAIRNVNIKKFLQSKDVNEEV